MADFMTRVELHGATYQDYETLHRSMEAEGFSRLIRGSDGTVYHLPTAEYVRSVAATIDQVRESARRAATTTGKSHAVLVTEFTRWTAWNLTPYNTRR